MPSIADVYATVLPETSKIADGLRRAFRDADPIAAEAGRRWGQEIQKGIGKVTVNVDADTAKAEAQIDAVGRDRKATVEVDADTLGSSVQRGVSQGGEAGISALQPALLGMGATMLAGIASSLSGLAGLLPAGLAGAGSVVGTLATGLDGVKEAWDSAGKAAASSGSDQAAKAREVASAQRELHDAVQSEEQAQKDVATARRDALTQLRDLNLELRGGALDEKQAQLDALKARQDLATGQFKTALDYEQAQLRVQEADQRVAESHQRNIDLQTKANDERAKGVDNADGVVRANQTLARSQEQVAAAQDNLNTVTNKMSSAAQTAAQDMAKLSPNAQAFVQTLIGLKPVWDQLKNSVQDSLFANIGPQIQQLATQYFPLLQSVMTGLAGTMNQAFGQLAQFFSQPQTMASMQTIFANIGESFKVWAQAIQPFAAAFLRVTEVGSGFLPQLAGMVVQVANAFNQWAQSGQLGEWIQTGMTALQQLGGIIQTLLPMFGQLAPIGTATLGALQTVLTALAPAIGPLSTAFASLISALSPLLGLIGQFISQVIVAVAPAFTQWFNAMAPVMQQLSAALLPVIQQLAPYLGQLAMVLSNAMVQGIQTLLPVLVPFVQQLGQLLVAVAPLLPTLVQIAISAIPVMQQAISTLLPVMTTWMGYLTNLANLIIPPLTKVVEFLGKAFSTQFDHIKTVVSTVWDVVRPIFDLWGKAIDDLTAPFQRLVDLINKIPGVSSVLHGLGIVADTLLPGSTPSATPPAPGTTLAPTLGAPSVPGALGGPAGSQAQHRGGAAAVSQASIAQAIFTAVTGAGYSPDVGMAAVQAGLLESGLSPTARNSGHNSIFQTSADKGVPDDPAAQIQWLLKEMGAQGGPSAANADPLNFFADKIERGGYLGSNYNKFAEQAKTLIGSAAAQGLTVAAPAVPTPVTAPTGALPDAHGAHSQIATLEELASQFGLQLTAGKDDHSKDQGYHPLGEAGDFGNGNMTPQEGAFANYLIQNFSPYLAEVINSSPGVQSNLKDGKATPVIDQPGSIYNSGQAGYHGDHVHVAIKDEMAAAFQQAVASSGAGIPNAMAPATTGPTGGSTDPYYTVYPDGYKPPGPDVEQFGQSMGNDLGDLFLPDGFKNPKDFGIAKLATGFINGLTGLKLGGKNDSSSADSGGGSGGGGGGIGGLIAGFLGIKPDPVGALQSGSPGNAPGEFMPMMPNPADAAISPFQVTGPPGTAGPGNQNNSINIINPVGQDHLQTMVTTATQAQVPRVRQGVRPLPG